MNVLLYVAINLDCSGARRLTGVRGQPVGIVKAYCTRRCVCNKMIWVEIHELSFIYLSRQFLINVSSVFHVPSSTFLSRDGVCDGGENDSLTVGCYLRHRVF